MNYQVTLYSSMGERKLRIHADANNHLSALKQVLMSTKKSWAHACVTGKITRRYNTSLKILKGETRYFKTFNNDYPAILVLIGTTPEFHRYPNETQRDEAYQLCTKSPSVEFVKADLEPIDTTVSSGETSASKTGWIAKKTSNGSVTPATWQDSETPESIEESSGKSNYDVTVKGEWLPGYKPAPSKSKSSTFLIAKVKDVRLFTTDDGATFVPAMKKYIGRIIRLTPHYDNFTHQGWEFSKKWLEPVKKSYAALPETGMTSEKIQKIQANLDKFKFVSGVWGNTKKGIGDIDSSGV